MIRLMDDTDRAFIREQRERELALAAFQAGLNTAIPRESALHCEICDEDIPEGRRLAIPGVQHCVRCQERVERIPHIADWKP